MAKNRIKKMIKVKDEESQMGVRTLIITFVVMIVLSLTTYYLTEMMAKKSEVKEENSTISEINYKQVLLGNIFDLKDKSYYVLIYDFEDKQINFFDELKQGYVNTFQTELYESNLKEALNKPYIAETSNPKVTGLKDLKVAGDTLILIKEGKVEKYLEGPNKIKEELNKDIR